MKKLAFLSVLVPFLVSAALGPDTMKDDIPGTNTVKDIVTAGAVDLATKAELNAHTSSSNNPHGVTAAQAGAYTTGQTDSLVAGVQSNITAHTTRADNPHAVTASQVGAYTKGETDSLVSGVQSNLTVHTGSTNNPHHVTAAQAGAYTKAETDAKDTVLSNAVESVTSNLTAHTSRSDNPHGVTASQVGAYTKAEADARVVDSIASTATDRPLSANMGRELQEEIDNIKSRGRYLSVWDCATGLPRTDPTVSNYVYRTGDYFIVGHVAETNYCPVGTNYIVRVPSTSIETNDVKVNDTYCFDGTVWALLKAAEKDVTFGAIVGSPYDNASLKAALDAKTETNDVLNLALPASKTGTIYHVGGKVRMRNTLQVDGKVTAKNDLDVDGDMNVQGDAFFGGNVYGTEIGGEGINLEAGSDIKIDNEKVVYKITVNGTTEKRGDVELNIPACYEADPALANRAYSAVQADSAAAPRINGIVSSWTDMCATYETDPKSIKKNRGNTDVTLPFNIKDSDGDGLQITYTQLVFTDSDGDTIKISPGGIDSRISGQANFTKGWRDLAVTSAFDAQPTSGSANGVKSGGVYSWAEGRYLKSSDAATTYLTQQNAATTYETKADATAKNNARIADITAVSNLVGNCRTKYDLAYYRSDWDINKVAQQYIPALAALFEFKVVLITDFSTKGMIIHARNNSGSESDWFPVAESVETYPTAEAVLAAETFTVGLMYDSRFSGIAGKTITKHYIDGSLAIASTTLSGYGITDAYTKTQIDEMMTAASNRVTTVATSAANAGTAAANAQTTANTAVQNAATAQTTANTAVTNAATAQATANSASSAAATAQTTANSASSAASTAQTTANAKLAHTDDSGYGSGNNLSWQSGTLYLYDSSQYYYAYMGPGEMGIYGYDPYYGYTRSISFYDLQSQMDNISSEVSYMYNYFPSYYEMQSEISSSISYAISTTNPVLINVIDSEIDATKSHFKTQVEIAAPISATNPTFSNNVMAVCLNINTNVVAEINELTRRGSFTSNCWVVVDDYFQNNTIVKAVLKDRNYREQDRGSGWGYMIYDRTTEDRAWLLYVPQLTATMTSTALTNSQTVSVLDTQGSPINVSLLGFHGNALVTDVFTLGDLSAEVVWTEGKQGTNGCHSATYDISAVKAPNGLDMFHMIATNVTYDSAAYGVSARFDATNSSFIVEYDGDAQINPYTRGTYHAVATISGVTATASGSSSVLSYAMSTAVTVTSPSVQGGTQSATVATTPNVTVATTHTTNVLVATATPAARMATVVTAHYYWDPVLRRTWKVDVANGCFYSHIVSEKNLTIKEQ